MPDWAAVILLGIIEGVTEFLPVSSTGHLLIAQHWLGHQPQVFNIVIQSGAVLAVILVFAGRLQRMVFHWRERESRDYLLKLAAAFVLTGVGGYVLRKKLGIELPETTVPVAWATLIGGVLFLVVERWLRGRHTTDDLTWKVALLVGAGQLLAAVFPGASRSGSTILMALALGVSRPAATEFSFLLGIPTLLAAGALELHGALSDAAAPAVQWDLLLLGVVVSAVTAFASVKWLLHFVRSHTFEAFGWYRIALGVLLLITLRWWSA